MTDPLVRGDQARPPAHRRWPVNTASIANAVLIAGGTLAIWTIWRHRFPSGIGQPEIVWDRQTVAFAGLAALFISSLALRRRQRMMVALASSSLIAVLYAVELVLATTALGPSANAPFWLVERASPQARKEIAAVAAQSGVAIDTRAVGQILDDSRRQGVDIVPAVMLADVLSGGIGESTGGDDLLPLGGISNTLTLLCNEGQIVRYASDEHGFRNPAGIWRSPRADIAAVGQSSAQGYCVPDGKGFVDLLRSRELVVLNLGTSGQGSLLKLAAIKEYLPRHAPKTVLWVFAEGIDLPDMYLESTHPMSLRYLEHPTFSQHLLARQPEIDAALRRIVSGVEARERQAHPSVSPRALVEPILKLWHLRRKVERVYGLPSDETPGWSRFESAADQMMSNALAQARSVVGSWGGTLYFVYLPSWDRYRNGPRAAEREHTRVLSLVNALTIPVIDVQAAFDAHDDPLSLFPFRRFGHYNEQGNQIVADTILRLLSGT